MTSYFTSKGSDSPDGSGIASPTLGGANTASRSSALSNRLTSVLSASYADSDIRDALATLDLRNTRNTPETRRQLRLDVQKEVIDCNGDIVKDFGKVAEVGSILWMVFQLTWANRLRVATKTNRNRDRELAEYMRRDAQAHIACEARYRSSAGGSVVATPAEERGRDKTAFTRCIFETFSSSRR